jgi:hypothetical protein
MRAVSQGGRVDERQFDNLIRAWTRTTTRHAALRWLAATVIAAVVPKHPEVTAKSRKQKRRKDKKDECQGNGQCKPCQRCDNGKCRTDPGQENQPCGNCNRCQSGSCSKYDPSTACNGVCCQRGHACTPDGCCPSDLVIDGRCCPPPRVCNGACCAEGTTCDRKKGTCCQPCTAGRCCRNGETCIDPGLFGANFCCDTRLNTPCGDNGDGTHAYCCSNANEKCCDGECIPDNQPCCAGRRRANAEACCPPGTETCEADCCDTRTERCHEGQCHDICSLNEVYTVACNQGGDYWCCPERSPGCCRLSGGEPHCCPA